MDNYKDKYQEYLTLFDKELNRAIESLTGIPKTLKDAMEYAVCDGGKRVRPVLCLACAEMLGVSFDEVLKYAVAIEFIHSYSLVHDDLPAMDNDDYRRGKFSTHKKFGEAYGILAGDALLNFAFEYCLKGDFCDKDVKAIKVLANFAGPSGMIAGQVLDLKNEKNIAPSEKELYEIYLNKTAKLLTAPLLIASIFSGGKYYEELKEFGYNFGYTFQITDDVLDVEGTLDILGKTPNKDEKEDKLTSIKVFGIDGAKQMSKMHYNKCKSILECIENSEFLSELTYKMYVRNK